MRTSLTPKLATAWPIQFEQEQLDALKYIGRSNNKLAVCKVARIGADFLIRATELNGGVLPTVHQLLIRRARREAKRK